jgi:transitional endoplasmic reticulum ATPase
MFALTSNIFTLLEQTEACRTNGIPLKHGCILVGKFGTGKTLTARVTASKAVRNGWTFIYLKTPKLIAYALKMAEMYAPAVVFCEDIDHVVGETRDGDINVILNTLDGVDTKDKPIITVLTTNDIGSINAALLRPGRMDTVVLYTEPDAEAAIRFVALYARDDDGRSLMAPMGPEETRAVGASLSGYAPAFIAEAVQKAKRYAIHEHGANVTGKVTSDYLIAAAKVLQAHRKLMEKDEEDSKEIKISKAIKGIVKYALGQEIPF